MESLLLPEWKTSDAPVSYPDALAAMEARVAAIHAGEAPEMVWLLEHPPLYTAGTSAKAADLLTPDRFPVYETGRGGEYTYHGPGQRVAYVMLDLNKRGRDLRAFVHTLEQWIIDTLAQFNDALALLKGTSIGDEIRDALGMNGSAPWLIAGAIATHHIRGTDITLGAYWDGQIAIDFSMHSCPLRIVPTLVHEFEHARRSKEAGEPFAPTTNRVNIMMTSNLLLESARLIADCNHIEHERTGLEAMCLVCEQGADTVETDKKCTKLLNAWKQMLKKALKCTKGVQAVQNPPQALLDAESGMFASASGFDPNSCECCHVAAEAGGSGGGDDDGDGAAEGGGGGGA